MSADRELLELAAKAYADQSVKYIGGPHGGWVRVIGFNEDMACDVMSEWNPLIDDGDALRLGVKLGMHCDFGNAVVTHPYEICGEGAEPLSASRRAIVRTAAEIGKAMP